jgi:RimJ/RimL family protein N-acetyltransferase/ADP-ribose pyrophosphatase YjhB (NUDIX family)
MENVETERLLLEPWHERHRAPWRRLCCDPDVMRFIGAGDTWDAAKADEVFDRGLEHWREHGFGWRSALDKTTGEWLGFVGLNHVGPGTDGVPPEEVEIGWWIVRKAWGRGYASEGATAIRNEAFSRLGLERFIARLQPANSASARVAEKLGMTFERHTTGRNGEDLHVYSLGRDTRVSKGLAGAIRPIAAAVIRDGKRILVWEDHDPTTGEVVAVPLAGGIEFGETGAQAIARELNEEIGATPTRVCFLGLLEDIYEWAGQKRHELYLVYDVELRDRAIYEAEEVQVVEPDGTAYPARWRSLNEFRTWARLVPDGLLDLLE